GRQHPPRRSRRQRGQPHGARRRCDRARHREQPRRRLPHRAGRLLRPAVRRQVPDPPPAAGPSRRDRPVRVQRLVRRQPAPEGATAGADARLGQHPLRQPISGLRHGDAPARQRPRPDGADLLLPDDEGDAAGGPATAAGDGLEGLRRRGADRPGAAAPRRPQAGRAHRRDALGPRHAAAAARRDLGRGAPGGGGAASRHPFRAPRPQRRRYHGGGVLPGRPRCRGGADGPQRPVRVDPVTVAMSPRPINRWLFSPAVDLAAFLGSALFSLVLLAVGVRLGLIHQDTPEWTWVVGVLLIDVAHVWSTAFIVYFDPQELRRRIWLYSLVPLLAFLIGFLLYQHGEDL